MRYGESVSTWIEINCIDGGVDVGCSKVHYSSPIEPVKCVIFVYACRSVHRSLPPATATLVVLDCTVQFSNRPLGELRIQRNRFHLIQIVYFNSSGLEFA